MELGVKLCSLDVACIGLITEKSELTIHVSFSVTKNKHNNNDNNKQFVFANR